MFFSPVRLRVVIIQSLIERTSCSTASRLVPIGSPSLSKTSAIISPTGCLSSVCHVKKPIGNCPGTLSNVLPGTIKQCPDLAWNNLLNPTKFGATGIFNVENCPILHPFICSCILTMNCVNNSRQEIPHSLA